MEQGEKWGAGSFTASYDPVRRTASLSIGDRMLVLHPHQVDELHAVIDPLHARVVDHCWWGVTPQSLEC